MFFLVPTDYKDASQCAFLQKRNFVNLSFKSSQTMQEKWTNQEWYLWNSLKQDSFKTKFSSRWPKNTTKWEDKYNLRLISTQNISVRSFSKDIKVPEWKSTAHQCLYGNTFINCRKMHRPKKFMKRHKHFCVECAQTHINYTDEYCVRFFEENKFNLDLIWFRIFLLWYLHKTTKYFQQTTSRAFTHADGNIFLQESNQYFFSVRLSVFQRL